MSRKLRVFEVDEGEYWAAESGEQAAKLYVETSGDCVLETMEEFGPPQEVPEHQLANLMITEIDEPGHPQYSFAKALAEMTEPGFVATIHF